MNNTLILYHGNCYDGFGSAYSAWKKFGDAATYIPCHYGNPLPTVPSDATVYMIDFSGSREDIEKLYNHVDGRLTIIDHHHSAQQNLAGLDYAIFDMDKSGALLAWEYFHPGIEVPKLIQHISDRDLWQFKVPGTKEVHAALLSYRMNFNIWDNLDVEKLKEEGKSLLRVAEQTVAMICEKAFWGEIDGHKVIMVNATSHWSDVGDFLLKQYPAATFAASFFYVDGMKKWSLRSRSDFDVSVVAKTHGGGGHKQAAGFEEKRERM